MFPGILGDFHTKRILPGSYIGRAVHRSKKLGFDLEFPFPLKNPGLALTFLNSYVHLIQK